jgi:transcriptional regulator with XRE-family HTH domain
MAAAGADPIDVAVGARIRARRQALRMSQVTLAEHLGVSFQQVQKYERGANRISASMLVKTAWALDCTGSVLLGARAPDAEPETPQENALQAEINGLLATPGAEELLRAFGQLPAGEARASVIAIVSGLASGSYARRL